MEVRFSNLQRNGAHPGQERSYVGCQIREREENQAGSPVMSSLRGWKNNQTRGIVRRTFLVKGSSKLRVFTVMKKQVKPRSQMAQL